MPLIWAHKGEHAGQFVEVETQEEVDKAVKAGWGQDVAGTAGIDLIVPEDPPKATPVKPTIEKGVDASAAAPAEDAPAKGGEYKTRQLEAEKPGKTRTTKGD